MKRIMIIGCLLVVFLLSMNPVAPTIEYNQINANTMFRSEVPNSTIKRITTFLLKYNEYTEEIQRIQDIDCGCRNDMSNEHPSTYIPVLCELIILFCLSLEVLAFLVSGINGPLYNDILDFEEYIWFYIVPKFC